MAIPDELKYDNEDDFVQKFIIPLLHRLGFALVVNYHGRAEYGKDLVFAEVDRFGHVRYHGLQAKYVPSISLNEVEELVLDCRQAFTNHFVHPQTGTTERISSFYAVNAGSLGQEAILHYFNSLLPLYGGNVRLLQAKDLLTLDRWATINRKDMVGELLTGMLLELRSNRHQVKSIFPQYEKAVAAGAPIFLFVQLRLNAMSRYLEGPLLPMALSSDTVQLYWADVTLLMSLLNTFLYRGVQKGLNADPMIGTLASIGERIEKSASELEAAILKLVETLQVPNK